MKKMKLKKKKKWNKKKFMLYSCIFFMSASFCITVNTFKLKITMNNKEFIKYILYASNHNMDYKYNKKKIGFKIIKFFSNISFDQPSTILKSNYKGLTEEEESLNSKYIDDPYPEKKVDQPKIYIYNTHQLEEYAKNKYEKYNVTPNVLMAAYIFREKLNGLGLPTIVEQTEINEILKMNSWKYYKSYDVTRMLINQAKKDYTSLEYFIDLHRDSVAHNKTYLKIGSKEYAKVMFIVGLENKNYKENLAFTEGFHEAINKKYPSLSRGIYKKQGKGVNGVYNQDIDKHVILIELGGVDNTIEEVTNTIDALSEVLFEYIGGKE